MASKLIKLSLFILIFLILIQNVLANAAANLARDSQEEADLLKKQQESGCVLPLDFAKEKGCQLKYPGSYDKRVGSFICEFDHNHYYKIIADCKGGVASIQESNDYNSIYLMLVVVVIIAIGLIYLIILDIWA